MDVGEIEKRVEVVKAGDIPVEATIGGVVIQTVTELAKLADIISRAKVGVPLHCRGDAGTTFVLCLKAREWGMPIMSVIEQSFVVNDRLGYQSQMIHAVVEQNAPIKNRLRYQIIGEGGERRCKVWATFEGENEPHEYTSQTLDDFLKNRPKKKDGVGLGGSPLWDSNPEVQMFYSASRQWARLFCPDVIFGAYTPEEIEEGGGMIDVTPKVSELAQRLRDAKLAHVDPRGFEAGHVAKVVEGQLEPKPQMETGGVAGPVGDPTPDMVDTPETVAAKAAKAREVMESGRRIVEEANQKQADKPKAKRK